MRFTGDLSTSGITLHNDRLRVHILPEEGGRITSFFDMRSRIEFLLQPSEPYGQPGPLDPWDCFENSACAGIDDCLPSVGACGPETPGGPVPDHGDFWRLRWNVVSTSESDSVSMAATGYSRPLLFEKQLVLHDSSLEIRYRIRNMEDTPVPFLYALHPLFAIDPGDRIALPPEVSTVQVESSRLGRVGVPRSVIDWPKPGGAGSSLDLSRTEAISASTAEMLYTGRLRTGCCGLYRAQSGQGIAVRFDAEQLPYLGLWLCYGGWPEDAALPRQYAVAFEPTVAPQGTLAAALKHGQAPVIGAYASFEFSIVLDRIGIDPVDFDTFAAQCCENAYF
jgi:galactose mutarotase-like enzyme